MHSRSRFQEELEQFKTKETDENDDNEEDGVNGTMDALDLLKRVFQLKRFMGGESNNGEGGSSAGSGAGNAFKMDDSSSDPDDNLVQAGCTAVVAVKRGNELYVANAGDSRGVLCRAGKAVALSEDHKPAQETERSRIIAAGGFLSEIGGVCRWGPMDKGLSCRWQAHSCCCGHSFGVARQCHHHTLLGETRDGWAACVRLHLCSGFTDHALLLPAG